ncbi:hypothetical protein BLOT_006077 [Blomia tropicalis]|nr:hypothetical protein BLOT_006077 [Blomia tropicalis]
MVTTTVSTPPPTPPPLTLSSFLSIVDNNNNKFTNYFNSLVVDVVGDPLKIITLSNYSYMLINTLGNSFHLTPVYTYIVHYYCTVWWCKSLLIAYF